MTYDVLIVGGGVGGSACAILLRQQGMTVRLIEKMPDAQRYKKLCTHFIQPAAIPVLEQLNMAALASPPYSVRTKAAFITAAGYIDPEGGYGPASEGYALNLERSVLDPALRQRAESAGVESGFGERVTALERTPDGWTLTIEKDAQTQLVQGRMLVAADGRTSAIARLTGNEAVAHENQRATFFAYCSGIAAPEQGRSLFAHSAGGMAFLYPLTGGRTLLSAYVDKETAKRWQEEGAEQALLRYFTTVPQMPDVRNARFETPVYGYQDYPSLVRQSVHADIAFIGDAALSLDPMSGVGCSFALQAASMLAAALGEQASLPAALKAYAQRFNGYFPAHARGIIADSLITKDEARQQQLYQAILADPMLQRQYRDLTGRLLSPPAFQNAYLVSKARQRTATARAGA